MRNSPIFIIDTDAARLHGLLAARSAGAPGRDHEHLTDLASELERACVVGGDAVPAGVVTMYSRVRVTDPDSGACRELTLVFPPDADPSRGRVSVLAPLGCALMGCAEGEIVEWEMPGGLRRFRLDQVTPPAAGRREGEA